MATNSPGYGITIRVEGEPSSNPVAKIATVVTNEEATITAIDVVESLHDKVVVDVTCDTMNSEHAERISTAIEKNPALKVRKFSDRTFLLHLGGKLEIQSKVPLKTRDDLSRAYTPGVARICTAIANDKSDARRLTIKRNTVAVVTDGSAVLGLGNIGPEAALPVMEGKAALFKRFADVDAWPVCLDTQDVDEIVRTVQLIAPVYGGINLEDISAPRCFEVERRLRNLLDIPVFHDDQHGTAIISAAALLNALEIQKKKIDKVQFVVNGAGAAAMACIKLYESLGAKPSNFMMFDKKGILYKGRPDIEDHKLKFCVDAKFKDYDLAKAMKDADVFVGLSVGNVVTEEMVKSMAKNPIVFAMANPDPEITYDKALNARKDVIMATGRSDFPNQVNNVLGFPYIFRGALDVRAKNINEGKF